MDKFFESKFAKGLQKFGEKLGSNRYLQAISGGLMCTMGLMLLGAIFQIIATPPITAEMYAAGGTAAKLLGWWYNFATNYHDILIAPYNMSMNLISLFAAFGIAYILAKGYKMNALSSAVVSAVIFLLVAAPAKVYELADGSTVTALDTAALGGVGLFTAILVGIFSVKITKFCMDKKIYIRMPDVVPPFLSSSFASLVPLLFNVLIFHGINVLLQKFMGTTMPLAITGILSVPFGAVNSVPGMIILLLFCLLMWCFGIHGTMIGYIVIMPFMIQTILGNAALVAEGQQPIFHATLLFGAAACAGGTGNTLGLVLLGLRSKSEQIKAVSKAGLIPGFFGINEPVVFGMPVMYNPILAIPYILNPIIVLLLMWLGYATGILRPGYILLMSLMPIGVGEFLGSMSWTNALFPFLMIPVTMLIFYPFFKIYERQLMKKEEEVKAEAAALEGEATVNA